MKRIAQIIARGITDYGGTTSPEFKSFATKFKNDLKKEVESIGGTVTKCNPGHYYVSGFIRTKENQCYYFSISDVRHFKTYQILFRTAKDEKDFSGGHNQYLNMNSDVSIGEQMSRVIYR